MDITLMQPPATTQEAEEWYEGLYSLWHQLCYSEEMQRDFSPTERYDMYAHMFAAFSHTAFLYDYYWALANRGRLHTCRSLMMAYRDVLQQQYGHLFEHLFKNVELTQAQSAQLLLWKRSVENSMKLVNNSAQQLVPFYYCQNIRKANS